MTSANFLPYTDLHWLRLHSLRLRPDDAISTQQIHVHLRIARAVYTMHPEGFEDHIIPLSFIHFRPIICELRAIDASKLNTVNLSTRCMQLGAIRLYLKMHAMVARKSYGNCVVWTQPKDLIKYQILHSVENWDQTCIQLFRPMSLLNISHHYLWGDAQ